MDTHDAVFLTMIRRRYRAQFRAWAHRAGTMSLDGIQTMLDMVRSLHMSGDAETLTKRMDELQQRLAMSDPHIYLS